MNTHQTFIRMSEGHAISNHATNSPLQGPHSRHVLAHFVVQFRAMTIEARRHNLEVMRCLDVMLCLGYAMC